MPVMLHSYNRLLFLLLQRKGDVMIHHIAGLQISSPLESRRLDMLFCVGTRIWVCLNQLNYEHCVTRYHDIYIHNNITLQICSLLYDFKQFFLKIPKNVSFEKTSGRLNQISNYITGRYALRAARAQRSDFDDVNI